MLTATGSSRPSSSHRRTWARAWSSTDSVSGCTSPVRSATWTNSAGGSRPRCGWRPADQRLDAEHPAGQVALGLVVQDQLALGDRPGQVGQQAQPLGAVPVQGTVVGADADVRALRLLGRDVGVPQQGRPVVGVQRVHRDTGPRIQDDVDAADPDRRAQRRAQCLRVQQRCLDAVDVGQQHGELVAAEPGHQVVRTRAAGSAGAPLRARPRRRSRAPGCRSPHGTGPGRAARGPRCPDRRRSLRTARRRGGPGWPGR